MFSSGIFVYDSVYDVYMKVLVAWDAAEVRKIVDAANLLLDRLHLVEVSKSMRGLLICLKVV